MQSSNDIWIMLATWGSPFGFILVIMGTFLVIAGFKSQLAEAKKVDAFIHAQINNIAGDNKLDKAVSVRELRAKERRQAKIVCIMGFLFFISGFVLQAISDFPVR